MDQSFIIKNVRYNVIPGKLRYGQKLYVVHNSTKEGRKTQYGDIGILNTTKGLVQFEQHEEWFTYDKEKFKSLEPAKGDFRLKPNFKTPTDDSQYFCFHCQDKEHAIVKESTSSIGVQPGTWGSWINICNCCHRYTGPWCLYGDD